MKLPFSVWNKLIINFANIVCTIFKNFQVICFSVNLAIVEGPTNQNLLIWYLLIQQPTPMHSVIFLIFPVADSPVHLIFITSKTYFFPNVLIAILIKVLQLDSLTNFFECVYYIFILYGAAQIAKNIGGAGAPQID